MFNNDLETTQRLFEDHTHDGINSKKLGNTAQYFIGAGTRTIAEGVGDEIITCGFTPKMIRFHAGDNVARKGGFSIGTYYNGSTVTLVQTNASTGTIFLTDTTNLIRVTTYDSANKCQGRITATSATGFTLNWDDVDVECAYTYEIFG